MAKYTNSDFGKVAVLMGGESTEKEISLESGQAVINALHHAGINAHGFNVNKNTIYELMQNEFDRAFIILHGRGGEDGTIQGALETVGIPYTGSNLLSSALAMNKFLSKTLWRDAQLKTPAAVILNENSNWAHVVEQIGLPVMVKPVTEGSSFGASKVTKVDALPEAWRKASHFGGLVMAESWIEGSEYTVSILHDAVLPVMKLETTREFYDYTAKYEDSTTKYISPCGLTLEVEKSLGELSLHACNLLGVSGWCRVDLILDEQEQAWLIEVNTVPGMTTHSLVPMAAKQAGISFEELVIQILATSMPVATNGGSLNAS